MKYIRWYDKNPELKELMSFLEHMDEELRSEIAQDLIQIIMSEAQDSINANIEYLNSHKAPVYRRWYDQNPDLHSAIELIQRFDDRQKKEIIVRIMESIIQLAAETDENNE